MARTEFGKIQLKYFLDRDKVLKRIGRQRARILSRTGAYMRTVIKNRMKSGKGKAARGKAGQGKSGRFTKGKRKRGPAGVAPYYHTKLLKNRVFYALDPNTDSVVIGPQILRTKGWDTVRPLKARTLPELLDQGGAARFTTPDGESVLTEYRKRPIVDDADVREMAAEKLREFTQKIGLV